MKDHEGRKEETPAEQAARLLQENQARELRARARRGDLCAMAHLRAEESRESATRATLASKAVTAAAYDTLRSLGLLHRVQVVNADDPAGVHLYHRDGGPLAGAPPVVLDGAKLNDAAYVRAACEPLLTDEGPLTIAQAVRALRDCLDPRSIDFSTEEHLERAALAFLRWGIFSTADNLRDRLSDAQRTRDITIRPGVPSSTSGHVGPYLVIRWGGDAGHGVFDLARRADADDVYAPMTSPGEGLRDDAGLWGPAPASFAWKVEAGAGRVWSKPPPELSAYIDDRLDLVGQYTALIIEHADLNALRVRSMNQLARLAYLNDVMNSDYAYDMRREETALARHLARGEGGRW